MNNRAKIPKVQSTAKAIFNGNNDNKRVNLEIYATISTGMQTGQPYQTSLIPPPADAHCCHPPKTNQAK